jgi:hypothetical protein
MAPYELSSSSSSIIKRNINCPAQKLSREKKKKKKKTKKQRTFQKKKKITTNLPKEGDEVKDVVRDCGPLRVASVDVYGAEELLSPRGLVQLQTVQVLLRFLGDASHHTVEF